jgi:two-component system sensor histidine kinase LytS
VDISLSDEIKSLLVPAFMIQPLVENSILHAFPAEGQLVISIRGEIKGEDFYLYVADNGTGMTEEQVKNIMDPSSQTGLGIAVKNVNDRICGYFGEESYMKYASELGKGTQVTLYLKGCAAE